MFGEWVIAGIAFGVKVFFTLFTVGAGLMALLGIGSVIGGMIGHGEEEDDDAGKPV